MIQKVKLYVNSTKEKAHSLAIDIEKELIKQGYDIAECDADLVIGLGGDGTLLNFLRENSYETQAKYIGVNCGTLGFLQDFEVEDVEKFVLGIPNYVEQRLGFVSANVIKGKQIETFYALNEITIQDTENKSFRTRLSIMDEKQKEFLEDYVGTGLIFATPTGSTALNLSAGGCIMHPSIEAFQITPREAIANSKMHCLSKSICVPKTSDVLLTPNIDNDIKVSADCIDEYVGSYDVIHVHYSDKHMIKLKDKSSNFIRTIREKLI